MGKVPAIVPISDLREDAANVLDRVKRTHEPVVITQRGRAAAVMVSDADLTPTRLRLEVNALLADHERRERMAVAAARLARPDAASAIADHLLELAS